MKSLKLKEPKKITSKPIKRETVKSRTKKAEGNVSPQGIFGKKRPGPAAQTEMPRPERDLADAALIIELVEKGTLKTSGIEKQQNPQTSSSLKPARLNSEEEAELAKRVRQFGDIDARNALVMSNLGLVHLIAHQFHRPNLRYEDLLQEGTMGLIRATETFEPDRSIRFSTYSVYWIRAKIQRLIERLEKDDRPSIAGAPLLTTRSGRKVRPRARNLSIDRPIEGDESRTLSDILPATEDDPEGFALKQEKAKMVKEILKTIVEEMKDPRLNTLIELRLLADEPLNLTDIGQKMNLSREGARQLESRMLKLARNRLAEWYRND